MRATTRTDEFQAVQRESTQVMAELRKVLIFLPSFEIDFPRTGRLFQASLPLWGPHLGVNPGNSYYPNGTGGL